MFLNKELLEYKNNLYYIYRKINESQIKEGKVNDLRDFLNCDLVLKEKRGHSNKLLFLREISDATIEEEINN